MLQLDAEEFSNFLSRCFFFDVEVSTTSSIMKTFLAGTLAGDSVKMIFVAGIFREVLFRFFFFGLSTSIGVFLSPCDISYIR